MKRKLWIAAFAFASTAGSLTAIEHSLLDNQLLDYLNYVVEQASEPLPAIITKYYDRGQQGLYDIAFDELVLLYNELDKSFHEES